MSTGKLALVAGEASGDLLGSLLLDGLQAQGLRWQGVGIGGPQLVQRGFEAWWPSDRLAVHGFNWDTLRRYRDIVAIRRALRARLLAQPPELFVGVDAPDFNLALEADLRAAGVPTVHFVCPSVWAWRPERLALIRRSASHVLCLFPFEPDLLAQHGIAATYVGHPLAQMIAPQPDRAGARAALGLAADAPVLAILPGSRASEVRYLAAPFFRAATLVRRAYPALQCIAPVAPGMHAALRQAAAEAGLTLGPGGAQGGGLQLVEGRSHQVLAACDLTLIASGTATLEAALFQRPMVIAYRMSALSWALMRRKRLQPWVGLPNILCADFVVPELLQEAATPERLAAELLRWLDAIAQRSDTIERLQQRFAALHAQLRRDTGALAAHALQTVLQNRTQTA